MRNAVLAVQVIIITKESIPVCRLLHHFLHGVVQEGLKLVSPVNNHVDSGLARYR